MRRGCGVVGVGHGGLGYRGGEAQQAGGVGSTCAETARTHGYLGPNGLKAG